MMCEKKHRLKWSFTFSNDADITIEVRNEMKNSMVYNLQWIEKFGILSASHTLVLGPNSKGALRNLVIGIGKRVSKKTGFVGSPFIKNIFYFIIQ